MRSRFLFPLLLFVMVGSGLGIFYSIQHGWYPVLIVNRSFISARSFEDAVNSVFHYYAQLKETYNLEEQNLDDPASMREIRRATLDKFIENKIVFLELASTNNADVRVKIESEIASLKLANPEFETAVSVLYGLDVEKFKTLILEPQARQEVLEEAYLKNSKKISFSEWLIKQREAASVFILARGFYWDGKQVVSK